MGRPLPKPKVLRPSPLQQVVTRPLSQFPLSQTAPEMGLVRDPAFWKRFSVAVHRAESDIEMGLRTPASSVDIKYGDQWLEQQHKDKRRCRTICVVITISVIIVLAAAAVVGWYFVNH